MSSEEEDTYMYVILGGGYIQTFLTWLRACMARNLASALG
jgi:hypothetical protein